MVEVRGVTSAYLSGDNKGPIRTGHLEILGGGGVALIGCLGGDLAVVLPSSVATVADMRGKSLSPSLTGTLTISCQLH